MPTELTRCPKLQPVSARAGQDEVVPLERVMQLWAEDRMVAGACARRLAGAVSFYERLRVETEKAAGD